MPIVTTSKELGKAIKEGESTITIEGDLVNKIIRIKATGKLAWAVCGGALATAIGLYLATPSATVGGAVASAPAGGIGGPIAGSVSFAGGVALSAVPAATIGIGATTVAIGVGIAAGGIGGLISLRDKYKITEKGEKRLVLSKKS